VKKSPNPKFFMVLTAATVLVGVGLSVVQYSGLKDTEQRVAKLKKDSLDQSELENQLKGSLTKVQQCSASLNHLEKGVPELDYVPTMLKELENIGTQSGLQVLGVRPVPKTDAAAKAADTDKSKKVHKAYTELDIEVTCRGNYHAVKNFVQALQAFPKIVAARTVSLTPKSDGKKEAGPPKLEVTISLRSYLFPPDKTDMKQATPAGVNENQEAVNNVS
jgi:Tfp pilus assembly protein PilO